MLLGGEMGGGGGATIAPHHLSLPTWHLQSINYVGTGNLELTHPPTAEGDHPQFV